MHTSFSRIAAQLVALAGISFAGTACSDTAQAPKTPASRPPGALASRHPTGRSLGIQQRVAAKRNQKLSADEKARVKSVRGKWQWVADIHHQAMQEAIHDPSLRGLRKQPPAAERCATATRYLTKYFPIIEDRTGRHYTDETRKAEINRIGLQTGVCPANRSQASIFATPTPGAKPLAGSARAGIISPEGITTSAQQVSTEVQAYALALATDLEQAKDLGDANDIMDAYVATAVADPELPPAALAIFAGAVDLAASSALEWDTFARPHVGSMFIWGWLSDVGHWVGNVLSADFGGCVDAVEIEFSWMVTEQWSGTLGEFVYITAGFCAAGAIFGSIGEAI